MPCAFLAFSHFLGCFLPTIPAKRSPLPWAIIAYYPIAPSRVLLTVYFILAIRTGLGHPVGHDIEREGILASTPTNRLAFGGGRDVDVYNLDVVIHIDIGGGQRGNGMGGGTARGKETIDGHRIFIRFFHRCFQRWKGVRFGRIMNVM